MEDRVLLVTAYWRTNLTLRQLLASATHSPIKVDTSRYGRKRTGAHCHGQGTSTSLRLTSMTSL
jgi:hypothetical protein